MRGSEEALPAVRALPSGLRWSATTSADPHEELHRAEPRAAIHLPLDRNHLPSQEPDLGGGAVQEVRGGENQRSSGDRRRPVHSSVRDRLHPRSEAGHRGGHLD